MSSSKTYEMFYLASLDLWIALLRSGRQNLVDNTGSCADEKIRHGKIIRNLCRFIALSDLLFCDHCVDLCRSQESCLGIRDFCCELSSVSGAETPSELTGGGQLQITRKNSLLEIALQLCKLLRLQQ
jgi:hypothetical protein